MPSVLKLGASNVHIDIGAVSPKTQMLRDIICTAIEGGINYWCARSRKSLLTPDGDYVEVYIREHDDDGDPTGKELTIDANTIIRGISSILQGQVKTNSEVRKAIAGDNANPEHAGMIDADAADCIVQAGLFGEIRYG